VIAGQTGFLIAPLNPQILADKLTYLLTHSEAARAMGRAGRERVKQNFSLDIMIRNHQGYYRRLVAT
jgi:glycosyltransferase involved in cell wall biosynthesis